MTEDSGNNKNGKGREPIPPGRRKILQQLFESGSKSAAKGDFDYATLQFTRCVIDDPGNLIYLSNFIGNLQKKYNNNKKGARLSGFKGAASKGALKKATMQKDWRGVIKAGVELLKLNPWDTTTLTIMAEAAEEMDYDECQLCYLKSALDANIKDPEINRKAARALASLHRYDEAIICWRRVQETLRDDEEANKGIGDCTVNRTIKTGGYEDAKDTKDVRADQGERPGLNRTPEEQFKRNIQKNPDEVSNYIQLADYYLQKENFDEALTTLEEAFNVSGGDLNIRERIEDVQLRRIRENYSIAKKLAESEKSAETINNYKQVKAELNKVEMEYYRNRAERYPNHIGYRYELGLRLFRNKKYPEAITAFQVARNDPQRQGDVQLVLGECFQAIKQYKLSMSNYEEAIAKIPDRSADSKKRALYRAGRLALSLKDAVKAEDYLTRLAGMDYSYADVGDLLEKVRKLQEDQDEG